MGVNENDRTKQVLNDATAADELSNKFEVKGSGCGSVARAVASHRSAVRIQSSTKFILNNVYCQL